MTSVRFSDILKFASGNLLPGVVLIILPFLFTSAIDRHNFESYLLIYVTVIYCQMLDFGLSRASFLLMKHLNIVNHYFQSVKFILAHLVLFVCVSLIGVMYYIYVNSMLTVSNTALFFFILVSVISNYIKNLLDSLKYYSWAALLRSSSILLPVIFIVSYDFNTTALNLSSISLTIICILCVQKLIFDTGNKLISVNNSSILNLQTDLNNLQYRNQAIQLFLLSGLIFISNYFDRLYLSAVLGGAIYFQYLFMMELCMRGLVVSSIFSNYLISTGELSKQKLNIKLLCYFLLFNILFLCIFAIFLFIYVDFFRDEVFYLLDASLLQILIMSITVNSLSSYLSSYLEAQKYQKTRILVFIGSMILMVGSFLSFNIVNVSQAALIWLLRALYELCTFSCIVGFNYQRNKKIGKYWCNRSG